jgi:ubiquinone biosynthesis protein
MDAMLGWRLVISLPAILLIAWLSGRLLGVSRSWAATAVAGLSGWLAALALSIAGGDTGAAGFTRNLWVFAAVFTMSASVWTELLAKPGTLARAQSGLVSVPRPLRALRRSSRRLSRYAQITGIAVRHGFGPVLGLARADDEQAVQPAAPAARRLRLALEECGGMFVKLGQLLSTRADLLPAGVIAELARLQDRVAPAPADAVRALLEAELGRPLQEAFAEFDPEPLAAASIGQAYRARLRSGERVIVKVQRPGIAEAVDRDLLVLARLAEAVEARTAWGADYHVTELAGEFAERLREELDFRLEARNATEIAAGLAGGDQVRIPAVHRELSTARVLVMEWLDGVSVRETGRIDALGLDRQPGRGAAALRALADAGRGALPRRPASGQRVRAGGRPAGADRLRRHRPVGRPAAGVDAGDAGGRAATGRRHAARGRAGGGHPASPVRRRPAGAGPGPLHGQAPGRRRRPERGDVQRPAAAVLHLRDHAAAGVLDLLPRPGDAGGDADHAVARLPGDRGRRADRGRVGPRPTGPSSLEELAKRELGSLALLLRRAPRHLDRIATIVQRGDLRARVSLFGDEQDVRTLTRLLNRVVLAGLGGIVGVLSVMLLGTQGGPPFTGDTSLFQFFGYFGLFCATVLILRVIVAVLREGLN